MAPENKYSFPTEAALRDALAYDRTKMAIERTFLAYTRTALTFFVAGLSFIQFFENTLTVAIGWVFVPLGIFTFLWGVRSQHRVKRLIADEKKHFDAIWGKSPEQ